MAFEGAIFLAVVVAQRLGELMLSRTNTRALLARGGREVGAMHYPTMVSLHTSWLVLLSVVGWNAPVSPPWLAAYVILQVARVWILTSLRSRWTTRIIIIDEPLVRAGPYRFLKHPNYVLVAAEFVVVPMVLGQIWIAVIYSALNALMLVVRIRAENRALYPPPSS
jgi:methyltransferase